MNMIETRLRNNIRMLRRQGMTYRQICESIGVEISKGTLSYICRDIVMTSEYYAKVRINNLAHLNSARKRALSVNSNKLAQRMQIITARAQKVINGLSSKDHAKIHLAMLYKAEGSKYKSYRGLAMGSSEPSILRIYMRLLEECYGKKRQDFKARVQSRADQDIVKNEDYWRGKLGMRGNMFYKTTPDKRTIGKQTKSETYMGVCVVSCSGADIQLELDAIAELYSKKLWGISSLG